MEIEKNFNPYLAKKVISEDEYYVVWFIEPNYGIVVVNETKDENIRFGLLGDFSEEQFEILPPELQVSISN